MYAAGEVVHRLFCIFLNSNDLKAGSSKSVECCLETGKRRRYGLCSAIL